MQAFPVPAVALVVLALGSPARAQWSYPGCEDVTQASFKQEVLAQRGGAADPDLDEPLKMAFDMDASGTVDLYYVERKGKLKVWHGATRSSSLLGKLSVRGGTGSAEEGLLGVVLDPGFKQNRWLYLFYNPASQDLYRLSRFTLNASGLDLSSEKVLLQFPHDSRACCHNGGAIHFDAYGDLWVSVGGNGSNKGGPIDEAASYFSEEDGASNTADLRGSILRIRPDGSPRGYGIPAGNFGEYFAERARKAGQSALAAQFADTGLVKPEIYIKGGRNPYTMSLDPVRRWVTFGDVGPDNGAQMEEHNLFKAPAFAGWPYFAGKNLMYKGDKDASAPANSSNWNTGIKTLPPASPAIRSYGTATAITGPIYRYDGDLASQGKLPPQFDRKWFIGEFKLNWIRVITLDEAGDRILKEEPIFTGFRFSNPLDIQAGPDGALYVINYSGWFNSTSTTSIVRLSYTGSCRPATPKLEQPPSSLVMQGASGAHAVGHRLAYVGSDRVLALRPGETAFGLYDAAGKRVFRAAAMGAADYCLLPTFLPLGIYHLRVERP